MSFSDLPSVRDATAKFPCHKACSCGSHEHAEEVGKDRRLQNWEKWSALHKRTNDVFSQALHRLPYRTVMNSGDDLHTIKEEKAVLEYVNIPYPHDKYRGNPAFWKTPETLPDPKRSSEYAMVMTKEEKGEIPQIEYVKVPDYIKAEMGYHCLGPREALRRWNASEYRQQRVEVLKPQIAQVEPFRPDLNHLYIEGRAIQKKPLANIKLLHPSINDTVQTGQARAEFYIQVNDVKITASSAAPDKIYLAFARDTEDKNLRVTNATPVALRCYLERSENHSLFKDILPQTPPRKAFFFDMNEKVLIPSGTVEIPICFKPVGDGVFKEVWKLRTRPAVLTGDFTVVFEGVALDESLGEKCAALRRRIDERSARRAASTTVEEILCEIPRPQGEPVLYTYDRGMIFEAVNQNYDPFTRRPKYLYTKSVVDELEAFYARVKLPLHPENWNCNIEDLRSVTKQRERHDYEQKILSGIKAVKITDGRATEIADDASSRKLSAELEDIMSKLERPSVWVNLDTNKFEWTYQILCACFDKISGEMAELSARYFPMGRRVFRYPKIAGEIPAVCPQRNVTEFFDDAPIPGPFRIIGNSRKPPDRLKDIPMEDTMGRYKAYFGTSDEPDGAMGKKKHAKKGKETNEKKKKKKASKSNNVGVSRSAKLEYKLEEKFNPYAEVFIPPTPPELEEPQDIETNHLNPVFLQEYNDRTYFIFYTNLDSAIMRVCSVLDHQANRQVKLGVFKKILESNKRLSKPVKVKALDLKRAINQSFNLQEKFVFTPPISSKLEAADSQFRVSEAIQSKEEGSLWSILRGPKPPEVDQKPISYPEEQVIMKKRHQTQHALCEVGTIMAGAGIDPLWEDFKDVGVQTYESLLGSQDVNGGLQNVLLGVDQNTEENSKRSDSCNDNEGLDEDSFYDDEVPKLK